MCVQKSMLFGKTTSSGDDSNESHVIVAKSRDAEFCVPLSTGIISDGLHFGSVDLLPLDGGIRA